MSRALINMILKLAIFFWIMQGVYEDAMVVEIFNLLFSFELCQGLRLLLPA